MDFIIGLIFWILSGLILFSGLMVVTVKNIIHAALWLIASFAGVAAFYFLLEAPFIGVVQILVYTGAISILVLFAIMLTRQVTGEGTRQLFERWWVAAVVAVGLFALVIVPGVWSPELPVTQALTEPGQPAASPQPNYWPQSDPIAAQPAAADDPNNPQPEASPQTIAGAFEIGRSFMGEYLIPFEVSSILLLVALIGAVVIAYEERTRRRRILTLAEEAELRRSLTGLGLDRPMQASANVPPGKSEAGTAERR
ncbi:MAG TPA: NADH-quinone oxidoreductase subunit J [Herpetosiphonaceae bacterium]